MFLTLEEANVQCSCSNNFHTEACWAQYSLKVPCGAFTCRKKKKIFYPRPGDV